MGQEMSKQRRMHCILKRLLDLLLLIAISKLKLKLLAEMYSGMWQSVLYMLLVQNSVRVIYFVL